jgi:hypothetical protein
LPSLFGNSLLKDEIDSWKNFARALETEDLEIFLKIIEEASQYEDAMENSVEGNDTEAFLLSILLSQQKKIEELKQFVEAGKKQKKI